MNSLEIWHLKSLHSRGYLQYLEGFMEQTGVAMRKIIAEELGKLVIEIDEDDEEE